MNYHHVPILLDKVIEILNPKPGGVYVDATLGGGGHFKEIIKHAEFQGTFIGIDQDETAILNARETFSEYSCDIRLVHDNFSNIKNIIRDNNINKIDGILFDLGVSSHQLDEGSRGFSYKQDAELDMRMDRRMPLSAKDVVNRMPREELKRIIKEYGEEPWAGRIADFICERRKQREITTTGELVQIIKDAIPAKARRKGGHPARKTFQALRIYVNKELEILESSIKDAVDLLNPAGRICVITFHSLEDRIIKDTFKFLATDCICPKEALVCTCDHIKIIKILTSKPIYPSQAEIDSNPRARSAKLRAAEKLFVLKPGEGE
ncbi:MAG TPA: 16S rRNA (cytosine(1402)-N(4))-methyltransferase RsmH [Thermoanaerobacterales bacterium]|uniref:16S rRNA (cytosine(1402)-N(4))-methyltransferase RsmH n=1 Tax=Tepidanaerobacter sp. GT38 TaxID=2722793 RepID=UPI001800D261|nr:16S rRNA (cytosine(1402)-N(4))-methyltransferase RsmH [Tepidanaerobacter sp. GT38]MCG1012159.1 16S rRNA (cytosine(1402)-N(4))-methyltransferase RsmH [Tepidanaerobacter sp. GT38]HHY42381.1 16S rRNA (cytosine(1402)-N(4))-methyltransferase RsmH [Thermoanaerobacterales bacterium]